jgi:hypothetical protein
MVLAASKRDAAEPQLALSHRFVALSMGLSRARTSTGY